MHRVQKSTRATDTIRVRSVFVRDRHHISDTLLYCLVDGTSLPSFVRVALLVNVELPLTLNMLVPQAFWK